MIKSEPESNSTLFAKTVRLSQNSPALLGGEFASPYVNSIALMHLTFDGEGR
jgi:hypothetical protein